MEQAPLTTHFANTPNKVLAVFTPWQSASSGTLAAGSLENYDIHMQGLARVISLRGGLTSLGLNGLLHRIVVWIDHNAAFLHDFPTSVAGEPLPDPNPGHFLGIS